MSVIHNCLQGSLNHASQLADTAETINLYIVRELSKKSCKRRHNFFIN